MVLPRFRIRRQEWPFGLVRSGLSLDNDAPLAKVRDGYILAYGSVEWKIDAFLQERERRQSGDWIFTNNHIN